MKITGPNWPSTYKLREALKDIEPLNTTINWGQGGKNGLQQLEALKTTGIRCPIFTSNLQEAKKWVRSGLKVWKRNLNHTQGNDIQGSGYKRIQKLRGVKETWNPKWLEGDFWVQQIEFKNEYRQHILDGKAIRRGKKIKVGEPTRKLEIHSRKNGWHLDYGPFEAPLQLREISKQAVKAVGYEWGAVDVIEDPNGELWVLEINSAPSLLDDNTLNAYVRGFKERG